MPGCAAVQVEEEDHKELDGLRWRKKLDRLGKMCHRASNLLFFFLLISSQKQDGQRETGGGFERFKTGFKQNFKT
jgi:hypothetical protein